MKTVLNPTFYYFWYQVVPGEVFFYFRIWRLKLLDLFSVPIILRTFFEPWKRDEIYVKTAPINIRFYIWVSNQISRLVGATLRFFVLFGFFLAMILWFFVLVSVLLIWLFFPLIIFLLLIAGVYYLTLGLNYGAI